MKKYRFVVVVLVSIALIVPILFEKDDADASVTSLASCPASTDLKTALNQSIDSRLSGKQATNDTLEVFSGFTVTSGGSSFIRNTNNWVYDLDLTGASPWNSQNNNGFTPGTLISPRNILSANHFGPSIGTELTFVTKNNEIVKRTIIAERVITDTDIRVSLLNSDVPPSISYFPVFNAASLKDSLTGDFPFVFLDQDEHAYVRNSSFYVYDLQQNSGLFAYNRPDQSTPDRVNFAKDLIVNDSGSPMFAIIGNQPVLVSEAYTTAYGPSYSNYISQINDAMDSMSPGGYHLSEVDLGTCFNKKPQVSSPVTLTIPDSLSAGDSVGFIGAIDNPQQSLTYSISGGDSNGAFNLNPSTGELTLAGGVNLNFQTKASYGLDVTITDNATVPLSTSAHINIIVQNATNRSSLSVDSPKSDSVVTQNLWAPKVNWGNATTCEYSYDKVSYSSATCSRNGGDIPAPSNLGSNTLYLRAKNTNGTTESSIPFTYSPTWSTLYNSGAKNWVGIAASKDGTKVFATEYVPEGGGSLYYSSNGGIDWTPKLTLNQDETFTSMASVSSDASIVAIAHGGYIYISKDGGSTWSKKTILGEGRWPSVAFSGNGSKMITFKLTGIPLGSLPVDYLNISNDGGETWNEITNLGPARWRGAAISDDGQKIAVIASGKNIFVSKDGGLTWQEKTSSGEFDWRNVVSSADGNKIVAIQKNGYIYISNDGGETWTSTTQSIGSKLWRGITMSADGKRLVAAAGFNYVYVSSDGGVTWTAQNDMGYSRTWSGHLLLPNVLSSSADGNRVFIFNAGDYIYLGTFNYTSTNAIVQPVIPTVQENITNTATTTPVIVNKPNVINTNPNNKGTSESLKALSLVTRDMGIGKTGEDVKSLQKYLNANGYTVSASGVGSLGNESTTFGGKTKLALTAFQKTNGIVPSTGYFGPLTRKLLQNLYQKSLTTSSPGCLPGQKFNILTGVACAN